MKIITSCLCFNLLCMLIACGKHRSKSVAEKLYVITVEDSLTNLKWKAKRIPPPPTVFYGDYTFVLDADNKLYLHNKKHDIICGTGLDNTKPPFIDLAPQDFKQVNQTDLTRFLANTDSVNKEKDFVIVASYADTIKGDAPIYPLVKCMTNSGISLKWWRIRRITEEEKTVLAYRRRNRNYDPEEIAWSTNFSSLWNVPETKKHH